MDFAGQAAVVSGAAQVAPFIAAVGAAVDAIGSTTTLDVPYPSGIQPYDVFVIQVGSRQYGGAAPTGPSGWIVAQGPQTQGNTTQTLFNRDSPATGLESGSVTITVGALNNMNVARMYLVRGVVHALLADGFAGIEQDTAVNSASGACPAADFPIVGPVRTVMAFDSVNAQLSLGAPGPSNGGPWVREAEYTTATGGDFAIGLSTRAFPKGGLITGGFYADAGGDSTVVRAFIVPGGRR